MTEYRTISLTTLLEQGIKINRLLINNPDCHWDEQRQVLLIRADSKTLTWLAIEYQGVFDASQ
jgi:hypothetical protein